MPFGFSFTSASAPTTVFLSSGSSLSAVSSRASFGSTSEWIFGSQPSQPATESSSFAQSSRSLDGSSTSPSTSVLGSSSLPSFGTLAVGSSTTFAKPFSFGLCSGYGQSSTALFTTGAGTSGSSSSPSFTLPVTSSNLFSWSSSSFVSPAPSSNLFGTPGSSSFASAATSPSLFSFDVKLVTSFIFGSGFGSGASASTGFSFGLSAAAPSTPSISFGSSTPFSFTSAPTATASAPAASPLSIFGTQAPATFGSSSPGGNDQMSVEDTMTDDTVQPAMPVAPVFGQAFSPAASNFSFGSPALQAGGTVPFQFGSQSTSSFGQSQTPFQASGNPEFSAGGSFSLGSGGGGDKPGRRIVKVKRISSKLRELQERVKGRDTPSISFGSSTPFLFTSAPTTTASAPAASPVSIFGTPAPVTFGSSSPGGNDQMSVEDTMTDDTAQPAMPVAPVFGRAPSPAASNFSFGSPALQMGGTVPFQFGGHSSPSFGQSQTPFQASGNLEFNAGGSFSLGSGGGGDISLGSGGGGDKSGRRIVKVKRTAGLSKLRELQERVKGRKQRLHGSRRYIPAPVTFGSSLLGGIDQMSIEDTMTDDTVQPAMPVAPVFGRAPSPAASKFSFGSPALQMGGTVSFQFGGQSSPSFGQSQTPFQSSGNLEFNAGGSFSLASGGGGDKSGRRIVKENCRIVKVKRTAGKGKR